TPFEVTILLGNGNGAFHSAGTFAVDYRPYIVVTGDVNGDGKLDLATANWSSGTVSVLLGNGNGTFQTQISVPDNGGGSDPVSLALGDVNGDGKLDLATANYSTNSVGVL